MNPKRLLTVTAIALLLMSVSSVSTAGFAEDHEDVPPLQTINDPDLEIAAKSLGLSTEATRHLFRSVDVMDELASTVAARWPDIFIVSAVSREPFGSPSLYVKGSPSRELLDLLAAAPMSIELVANQPYSGIELDQRQDKIWETLSAMGLDVRILTDKRTGKVEVAAFGGQSHNAASIEAALDFVPGDELDVILVDQPLLTLENASFGGMRGVSDGVKNCTFSFSVYDLDSSTTGVASAAHCNANQDGIVHPGYSTHAATMVVSHYGTYGDVGMWTTPKPEQPWFYADEGVSREVTSVETYSGLQLDEPVCIFSRARTPNERVCARVANTNLPCSPLNHLVLMDEHVTVGGDSGGGWSFNYRAFGTHMGGCGGSAFSPAYYHPSAISAAVMVAP